MQLAELRGHRQYADRAFSALAVAAAGLVLLILGMIAVVMTRRAWPAFGEPFFTSTRWSAADQIFGALPFVWGTLYTAVIAVAIAVPISLGVALYITQAAPPWLRKPMVYLIDLLAVVPSVVFGLWGVLVLSQHFGLGRSFLTAGIILAIMITPIVTSISKEVFATVPRDQKEAAWGLGATRFEMIRGSVFPYSRNGLVGAVMLGLGRAMGETIAVALVIGSVPAMSAHLFEPGDAMAAVIANQFGEATGTHRAALIGLGVVLFIMTVIVNVVARKITGRADRRLAGGAK